MGPGRREMNSVKMHLRGVGAGSSRVAVSRGCVVALLSIATVSVTCSIVLPLGGEAAAQEALSESVQSRPRLDFESYGIALDGADSAGVSGASLVQAFTRVELDTG